MLAIAPALKLEISGVIVKLPACATPVEVDVFVMAVTASAPTKDVVVNVVALVMSAYVVMPLYVELGGVSVTVTGLGVTVQVVAFVAPSKT